MPCSERSDPDRDTNIVETSLKRSKEAPKNLVMVPSGSIPVALGRAGALASRWVRWSVEPEEPITEALDGILSPPIAARISTSVREISPNSGMSASVVSARPSRPRASRWSRPCESRIGWRGPGAAGLGMRSPSICQV